MCLFHLASLCVINIFNPVYLNIYNHTFAPLYKAIIDKKRQFKMQLYLKHQHIAEAGQDNNTWEWLLTEFEANIQR